MCRVANLIIRPRKLAGKCSVNQIMSRLSSDIHKYFSDEVVNSLQLKKISTTLVFIDTDSEFLATITGLSFRRVQKMKDSIFAKFASKIRTGQKLYAEMLLDGAIISTGIKKLDEILKGGMYTGSLYELCGISSCGKSQICMSVAANVSQLLHTLKQPVLYVDTKGDFSAHRLAKMVAKEKAHAIFTRIGITQPRTAYELITYLHDFIKKAEEKTTRLMIIDSLAVLFYKLIGDHNESASLLSSVRSLLCYIANEMHVTVLVTNLTTSWHGGDSEEVHKAALGKFWAHVPSTRFLVAKIAGSGILMTVTKSSNLALGTAITLTVTDTGVQ